MITHIWINDELWDMYADTNIRHTLQVNDIADVKDRQASFTNNFSCPKTANNVRIARGLGVSSDTSEIPYQKPDCQVKIDGFDFIVKGWVNITETDEEYKLYIYSGLINFFKAIEKATLGDIVGTELDHVKNLSAVVNSWGNSTYKYLVTDYNGLTHYGPEDHTINIDHLIPSVYVPYLWDKVHETFGFTYDGSIFATTDFTNLLITYPKFISVEDVDTKVTGNYTRTVNNYGNAYSYYRGLFLAELENSRTFTADKEGKYRITFELNNTFSSNLGTTVKYYYSFNEEDIPWQDRVNTTLIAEFPTESGPREISFILDMMAGDKVSFFDYMAMNGVFTWVSDYTLTIDYINPGNTQFSEELKDFPVSEFIKEVLGVFSFTMFTDEYSNEIKYRTIQERLADAGVIDWSDKYINRDSESYVYQSYAQQNVFKHQYNDKESTYNNGILNVNNLNIPDSKVVFNSRMYSPEKQRTEFYVGSEGVEYLDVFKLYNKEVKERNNETTIEYKGLDKRFHFVRARTVNSTVQIGSKTLLETQTVNSFPVASFSGLKWSELLRKYYPNFGRILNDSRIHKINLNLNPVDLINIDFTRLYYFNQEQQRYILNRLNFDNNKSSGEFVRVKGYASDIVITEPVQPVLEIAWFDGSVAPRSGQDDTLQIIITVENPGDDEIISKTWQVYRDGTWTNLGVGNSPYTAHTLPGPQKYRLRAQTRESQVVYSNELEYSVVPAANCKQFRFAYDGYNANERDGYVLFKDCYNREQQEYFDYLTLQYTFEIREFCATEIIDYTGPVTDMTEYGNQPPCN